MGLNSSRRRGEGTSSPNALCSWRPEYLECLQTDGRWSRSSSPFQRSMECVLYAPEAGIDALCEMPPAARFEHRVLAIGPWIFRSITRVVCGGGSIELGARGYLEKPLQFGLAARQWEVVFDGQLIGMLTRGDGVIGAQNLDRQPIGTCVTPTVPGRLRHPAASSTEATTPWYTSLEISQNHVELRLPSFDGRQHPYDFACIPFIRGVSVRSLDLGWALAFLALSAHAALNLRIHTPRRSA